ncbi:MAG: hypothetical protein KC593_09060 [Myxococcales bacterium]|nr:hypothetical protein [Myxococcales bacterium]MCB9629871.1 hypothetical protein [Sandaracinaceae bacterium]
MASSSAVSTSPDPALRRGLALGLAVLALATSTLGSCLTCAGTGFTSVLALPGGTSPLTIVAPIVGLFVVASLMSIAALFVARDRGRAHRPVVLALPLVALALTLTAYALPCVVVTMAQRAETARAHEGLRVDDISAIDRPCDMVAERPNGTCPERYLCIASGDAHGAASAPRCQISCMGNPEFCGPGSHCAGAFCVLDR